MKRAMKQSTLTLILNGISILTLIYMVYSLIAYSIMQRVRKMVAGEAPEGTDGRGVTVAVLDTSASAGKR